MAARVPRESNGPSIDHVAENEALVLLGDLLRRAREERKLTMVALSATVSISQSRLSLIERGLYPTVAKEDLDRLTATLELAPPVAAEADRLLDLSRLPSTSMEVIGLRGFQRQQLDIAREEGRSRRIAHYSSVLVPGLLQLPSYSQALFLRIGMPRTRAEEAMQARQVRQKVLVDSKKTFRFILQESVLYTVMGGAKDHIDQLNWLSFMGGRPNVQLKILQASAGNDVDALHGFTVHDRRLVTAESMLEYQMSERATDIERFLQIFERLVAKSVEAEPRIKGILAESAGS